MDQARLARTRKRTAAWKTTRVPERNRTVVADVEDAHDQQLIVRYTAGEAAAAGRPLHIVHASDPRAGAEGHRRATAVTEALTAAAHAECPDLDIRAEQPTGKAAATLVDRSATAPFLVVGHRGTDGFPGCRWAR